MTDQRALVALPPMLPFNGIEAGSHSVTFNGTVTVGCNRIVS
jgi:hypothetical protein